jgi:hypothetical protein
MAAAAFPVFRTVTVQVAAAPATSWDGDTDEVIDKTAGSAAGAANAGVSIPPKRANASPSVSALIPVMHRSPSCTAS